MAERSGVGIRVSAGSVPLLPGARTHAERGVSFGGLERNQAYFDDGSKVVFEGIDDATRRLMLDPQTSGGLLVSVPGAHAADWDRERAAGEVGATMIGEVVAGSGVTIVA
jgi:selenide,water dikinase